MAVFRTIFAVFVTLLAASQAHAACAPFPKSDYLGNYTHDQVAGYVTKAHGGDWTPYLVALNRNLAQLEGLQRAGNGALLKVQGQERKASATDIAKYVYMSKQWIAVAECLAEQQAMAALNNFSTAAGSDETRPVLDTNTASRSTEVASAVSTGGAAAKQGETSIVTLESEVASVSIKPISVKIKASCENGVSVFRVFNTGSEWPETGTFSMYRLDGPNRQLISGRKMRLDAGDAKTFRVSKKQNLTGQVGIAIDPSWYKRDTHIDADVQCR